MSRNHNPDAKKPWPPKRLKHTLPKSQRNLAGTRSIITIDPEQKFGPAMSRLTDARKKFVIAYVQCPGRPQSHYTRMAGIGGTTNAQKAVASMLLHSPEIIDAIREYEEAEFGAAVPWARKRAIELTKSEDERIALKAIDLVLRHGGMVVAGTHDRLTVTHEDNRTTAELMDFLADYYKANPPKLEHKVSRETKVPIEGDFTEVPQEAA